MLHFIQTLVSRTAVPRWHPLRYPKLPFLKLPHSPTFVSYLRWFLLAHKCRSLDLLFSAVREFSPNAMAESWKKHPPMVSSESNLTRTTKFPETYSRLLIHRSRFYFSFFSFFSWSGSEMSTTSQPLIFPTAGAKHQMLFRFRMSIVSGPAVNRRMLTLVWCCFGLGETAAWTPSLRRACVQAGGKSWSPVVPRILQ